MRPYAAAFLFGNAFTWASLLWNRWRECWLKHLDGRPLAITPGTAAEGQWVSTAVPVTLHDACPTGAA